MISLQHVSFTYPGATDPVLRDVCLDVDEGEVVLVAGRTGTGKSTLLGTVNGLVPHFSGGHLAGLVTVAGQSTDTVPPRGFAHLVGYVGQDPLAGFVTDTVEEELAYGMEQLGVAPQTMRRRVEETLDLLGIAELRRRPLRTLSGGQQQRVAIGSVLTMHPRVLVLDEPTSALDPTAAEEVLATVARLAEDLGTTVVLAEHRMERVVPFVDTMVLVTGDGEVVSGSPADLLRDSPVAPPVVELGRLAGWDPLPLTVRAARRAAGPLRDRLATSQPSVSRSDGAEAGPAVQPVLSARDVVVRYGPKTAVRGVDLDLHPGQVVALMGRNGSGKSSLLWALQGSGERQGGSVDVAGEDPHERSAGRARQLVGLVPQSAADLLHLDSVGAECSAADAESDADRGTCATLLARLAPEIDPQAHPRDLSEGQKVALVLAVQLSAVPAVMLLDEPTRGLDYSAKAELGDVVASLARKGRAVVVATHDVEFVASVADRVVVMAEGEVVTDAPTHEALAGSPAFAPQTAKVLGARWLTPKAVARALEEVAV